MLGVLLDEADACEAAGQFLVQRVCDLGHAALVHQRKDRRLDRRQPRVQLHDLGAGATLVNRVRLAQHREHAAIKPGRRLDHVRQVPLALGLPVLGQFAPSSVEVFELLPRVLLVLGQIEVAAVGDALEFAKAGRREGKTVLDVAGRGRVMAQLVRVVLAQRQVVARESEFLPPVHALIAPELVPIARVVLVTEELDLHLLKLAAAIREVARRHLVAKRLARLPDAERHLDPRRVHDVLEVDEDPLRGFRAEVGCIVFGTESADDSLEHEIEVARRSQIPTISSER